MNAVEIRRKIYNAGWDLRIFLDGMNPRNKLDEIKSVLKSPQDRMRHPLVIGALLGVGYLGLCNGLRLLGESLSDPIATKTPESWENADISSEPIDWKSVLEGYLSPDEIAKINISSLEYNPRVKVSANQVTIIEMSPFNYKDESLNSSYNAVLLVVRPGSRELPFEEGSPGSWLTHIFTFENDLNNNQRYYYTLAFTQAYMNTAGLRFDCDGVPCLNVVTVEYPPSPELPSQPQGGLPQRQMKF